MTSIVEYLYVDEDRLNSYFEQLPSSPVAYDKVPTWKTWIGLTNVGAGSEQVVHQRTFTVHEKITRLLDHLLKSYLPESFLLVTCTARRVFIPSIKKFSEDTTSLRLWITTKVYSYEGEYPGFYAPNNLILIENCRKRVELSPSITFGLSGYSLLRLLLDTFTQDRLPVSPVIHGQLEKRLFPREDIFKILSDTGCHVADKRRIRTLLLIRRRVDKHVFGYPIFISVPI